MATSDSPLNVPNVTLAVARGANVEPDSGSLVIAGSGFGAAPNIILYRTMREDNFDPAVVPEGEIGVMSGSSRSAAFKGRNVFSGHSETGSKATLGFYPSETFFKYRHFVNIAVPDGFAMPGSDGTERTFATGSDWKPVWARNGGTGDNTKPDFAIPSHIGDAAFIAGGNATSLGTFRWISYSPSKWSWDALNGFGLIHNADDTDPVGTAVPQALYLCNPATGVGFTQISAPGYKNSGAGAVPNANAFMDQMLYSSYANNTPLNNAQAYYCDMYIAKESAPGANDWKQAVALGNAESLANCTQLQMKKPEAWTDTQIDLSIDEYEAATYTHYFVFSPTDGVTVIASGSLS